MKKKIVFLDGDGTIWYPKKTLRTQKPHWVYLDPDIKDNYLQHLALAPKIKKALVTLQARGIYLVIISASPQEEGLASKELREKLDHFDLADSFYAYRISAGNNLEGKAVIMLEVLKELSLEKRDAVMVGDSYFYDCLAAKSVGIDTLFIKNAVSEMPEILSDIRSIHEVYDLIEILE